MKTIIKTILFFSLITLMFSACTQREKAEPVISNTAVTSLVPSAIPNPTPIPMLPLNVVFSEYESNDDDKKIYIKTRYLKASDYEINSIGFYLAQLLEQDTKNFEEWLKKAAADYPATEENYINYGLTSIPEITENTSEYFSMYMDFYTNTGGAHGNLERYPYTFSAEGTQINSFTELLRAGITVSDVEAEINRQIKARIDGGDSAFYNSSVSFADFDEYPPFFIRNGIIVIYYQPYDIAPYAAGVPEFEMPPSIF